jgi:hypothetical protein
MNRIADDCPPYDPNDDDYPEGWHRRGVRLKRFRDVALFLVAAAVSYGVFKWLSMAASTT